MSSRCATIEDLFRELQVIGPFLNTFYFSLGAALLATLLGGTIAWIVTRTDTPLRGLGLLYRIRFVRHSVYSLYHRLDPCAREGRAGQLLA